MTGYPWQVGDALLADDLNAAIAGTSVPVGGSIQAALDALPATGGRVTLSANTIYLVPAGIASSKPNVTLAAPGWGTIIRRDPSFRTGMLVSLTGAGSIIENLTVDGNNVVPSNYGGYAEVATGGANCVVRNCQIVNGRGTTMLTLAGANSKALFNTITGPGVDLGSETGYGIWAINGDTVHIEGNVVTGTCIDGIGYQRSWLQSHRQSRFKLSPVSWERWWSGRLLRRQPEWHDRHGSEPGELHRSLSQR